MARVAQKPIPAKIRLYLNSVFLFEEFEMFNAPTRIERVLEDHGHNFRYEFVFENQDFSNKLGGYYNYYLREFKRTEIS